MIIVREMMPCNSFGTNGKMAEDRPGSLRFKALAEESGKMPVLNAVYTLLLLPTSQIVSSYIALASCTSHLDHLAHL